MLLKKVFKKELLTVFIILTLLGFGASFSCHSKTPADTLVIAASARVQSTDPRIISGDIYSQYIEQLRFLRLISYSESGKSIPMLAEKIETPSPTLWRVTIKKNQHFSNGEMITAKDVEATYLSIINSKPGFPPSPRKSAFLAVQSVSATSDFVIEFKLKKADAAFLTNLVIGILPAKVASSAPPNTIDGNKGYESGPYILSSINQTEVNFIRNEKYTFGAKPVLPKLKLKIISNSGTLYSALIKQDIDLVQNGLDPDKVNDIRTRLKKEFQVISIPKLAVTYLGLNFKNPLFQNINVRKAMAYGINVDAILKYRMHGSGIRSSSIFPPTFASFNKSLSPYPYDIEKAKEYLKKANLSQPPKFTLKISNTNRSTFEIAQSVAADLKKIGFIVSVEVLESLVFQDQLNKGMADAWIFAWVGFKDPNMLNFAFEGDMIPPNGRNRGHYKNAALDELLNQAGEEMDQEKRNSLYNKAQVIVYDDLPYIFLWHEMNEVVHQNSISGFRAYADGSYWSVIDVKKSQ